MAKPPYIRGIRAQGYISSTELTFVEQRRAEVAECIMLGAHTAAQVLARMQENRSQKGVSDGITGNAKTGSAARGIRGNFNASLRTIARDMAAVQERWGNAAADKIENARAVQLAQHQEIINSLWPWRKEPRTSEVILKALSQVAMLTGTNKPVQHEITMPPELVAMLNARGVKIADVFKAMMAQMLDEGSAPELGSGMPAVIEMPNHVE